MKFSDEELMVMFASGVTPAFDMLYERHKHRIFRFALACLQNQEDAEDAVQEVFIRAARSAKRYQPTGRFMSWLFQIAANRIRTLAAARAARQVIPLEYGEEAARCLTDDVDQAMELRECVTTCLATLSEQQRMALVLKEIEGQSYDGIAAALGLTPGHVRVLLHRARKRMAEALNEARNEVER